MELIAVTLPGLESACAEELEGGDVLAPGHVGVEAEVKKLLKKRTVDKILLPIAFFDLEEGIYDSLFSADASFSPKSFAVETKIWNSDLEGREVATEAGQAFVDRHNWEVDLNEPGLVVRVDVVGEKAICGVDMTKGMELSKRAWEPENNPLIAAAMVIWSGAESIVDPDCGDGTVVIEAALLGVDALGVNPKKNAVEKVMRAGADKRVKLAHSENVPFEAEAAVAFSPSEVPELPSVFFSGKKYDIPVLAEVKGGRVYRSEGARKTI